MSDSSSMFRAAGLALPGDDQATPDVSAPVSSPSAPGSMFAAAGLQLPGNGQTEKPQGRGVWQAVKDTFNPDNIVQGLLNLPQRAIEASARDVQNLGDTDRPVESVSPAVDAAMIFYGNRLTGMGAKKVATAAAPSTQAINKLVDMVGPENVPAAVNRLQANPRLTLADVSDTVRTATQGLIDPAQPKAQNAIVQAVDQRIKTAPDAANSAYTAAMGSNPNVVTMVEGLKEKARAAGREAIKPALEGAGLVDTTPVIAAIDAKLKPGVMAQAESGLPLSDVQQELARFKQELVTGSGETLFDPQRLHWVQSDIGDKAYQLSKSPDPKDRYLGGQLRDMNEKLIDQIDAASSGAYRPARAKFKDAEDISRAFESGFDTLKNRSGLSGALEDRPEAFAAWMKDATPEEVVARRIGTRADIDQKINGVKNPALAAEGVTRIPYNRDKLKMLFGEDEASRLIRTMEDAREEALTNNKLLAGAKTAETLAGQKALAVPQPGKSGNALQNLGAAAGLAEGASYLAAPFIGGYMPGIGAAAVGAGRGIGWAASRGIQKAAQLNALSRNAEFAKAAMVTGEPRNILMERLMAHPKVRAASQ